MTDHKNRHLAKIDPLKTRMIDFNGVKFIDIQHTLVEQPSVLPKVTYQLSMGLMFDTVVVIGARGFLLVGEFQQHKYPIVMLRKPGKLPGDVITQEYKKEYGKGKLELQLGWISETSNVLIIDDVMATGGTVRAAMDLVEECGGHVCGVITPFAVSDENDNLLVKDQTILSLLRYAMTSKMIEDRQKESNDDIAADTKSKANNSSHAQDNVFVVPLSLRPLVHVSNKIADVQWGDFTRSSNIKFNPQDFKNKHVYVLLDPSNDKETLNVIQLTSILYRKDPESVQIVMPFFEQGTQDRVEYITDKNGDQLETLALGDTMAKLLNHLKCPVYTFDIHSPQNIFAFHDMRNLSLVKALLRQYQEKYPDATVVFPDEGACKRFGVLVKPNTSIVTFRKKRGHNDTRIVHTDCGISHSRMVIVDDLVRSGGTMRQVALYLKEHGATEVDALFAHAAFEKTAANRMKIFDDVWTSDTCVNVPLQWVKIHCIDHMLKVLRQ